jgi:HlyD family secretion protein
MSVWAALAGIIAVVLMVRKTTTAEPMPSPPLPPATKPSLRGIGASGMVESLRENTSVGVPVAGLVREVRVRVWDRVEAGTPLLLLDDRELQAQLRTERADLAVREAELERVTRLSRRTESLRTEKAVSEEEADGRLDELVIQRARVEAARALVSRTEVLVDRLVVRAPVDGTILQVSTRAGEFVSPGASQAPILLGTTDRVQVRADVDEQVAPRVHPGRNATGFLKGDTSHPIAMEFVRIEPFVIPKRNLTGASSERVDTRVLQVIYAFANPTNRPVYVGQQMDLFIEE